MGQKDVLSARLDPETSEQLDEFADENSLSRSEAAERLIHQSLRIENGDVEIVPVSPDGGELEDLRRSVESNGEKGRYLFPLLGIGLVWIGVHLTTEIPVSLTVLTGIVLIFGLSYAYYAEYLSEVMNG